MYIYEYRGNITGHKLIKSKYSFSRIQQQPKQMSFGYLVLNANNMIAFLLWNNNLKLIFIFISQEMSVSSSPEKNEL